MRGHPENLFSQRICRKTQILIFDNTQMVNITNTQITGHITVSKTAESI